VTPSAIRDQLARVDLRASAIPTEIVHVVRDGKSTISVMVWAPHRDTGEDGWWSHMYEVPADVTDVVAFTVSCVQAAWRHELDEALHVDGRRLRDPHAEDA